MKIRFTAKARRDLVGIADYLIERHPLGADRVGQSIRGAIDQIALYPLSGRRQNIARVRKAVDPTFGYLIYYHLGEEDVVILTVQHPAQRRSFQDN